MNKYLKAPLLASLRTDKYTLNNDETQNISSIEQMTIYTALEHRNHISEHYIEILLISELVGSHVSTPNIFWALSKCLQGMNISLSDGGFICMDTTNVNFGKQYSLKWLFKNALPFGNVVGCWNHKVALCFKHLLNGFLDVLSADATLLAFFHHCLLVISFLINAADAYEECHVTPISRNIRWTAHDKY